MTARPLGMVSSTSRFHLRVRWGGTSTRMRLKPAMCAALAAMKVLPVPISPTRLVPWWALRERVTPRMASAWAPRGERNSWDRPWPFSEGR